VTDSKLRELERRWKETGSVEDELAWLRERVRSGAALDEASYARLATLDSPSAVAYLYSRALANPTRTAALALAGRCGDELAREALAGTEATNVLSKRLDDAVATRVDDIVSATPMADKTVRVITALAAARAAGSFVSSEEDLGPFKRVDSAVVAWVQCPCEEHEQLVEKEVSVAKRAHVARAGRRPREDTEALFSILEAAWAVVTGDGDWSKQQAKARGISHRMLGTSSEHGRHALGRASDSLGRRSVVDPLDTIQDSVARTLVRWVATDKLRPTIAPE